MGLYDCRCMVSGVSLKGAAAALVLLQKDGKGHRPIALAIKGNYNRLGSINGIDEDANTKLVLAYFLEQLRGGEFVVDEEYLRRLGRYPIKDIERLLACFERNMNDHGEAAVLGGKPVVFALVCRAVWDAVARAASPVGGSATEWFEQVFGDAPFAEGIYKGSLAKVSRHLRELSAVSTFLTDRTRKWKPADDPGHDFADDLRKYLKAARRTFRDSAVVLEGLNEYEREVGDLLEDD